MSKLQGELLKINEVLDSPEEVKRLLSEGDRLEVIDGVLYRRREATGLCSNPQLIVPKSLRDLDPSCAEHFKLSQNQQLIMVQ